MIQTRRRTSRMQAIVLVMFFMAILTTASYYASSLADLPPVQLPEVKPILLGQDISMRNSPDKRSLLSDTHNPDTFDKPVRKEMYHDSYTESSKQFLDETRALMGSVLDQKTFANAFSWHTRSAFNQKFNNSAELAFIKHTPAYTLPPNVTQPLRVMVVCGMHARELFSSDFCRSWLLYSALAVANGASGNAMAPFEWLYVPVSNPNGRDAVSSAYANQEGSVPWTMCHRGNVRGVDLNRNWRTYDTDLYVSASDKQTRKTREPHRFDNRAPLPEEAPGPESMSEAETMVLRDLIDEFRPDILLSVHTGMVSISYPNDDTMEEPPTYLGLMRMASKMVDWSDCRTFKPKCTSGQGSHALYVSKGTMTDYAYRLRRTALPFTVEVYSGPAPQDDRSWDNDPRVCFDFFNPPQNAIVYYLKRWRSLWKGLYYMSTQDQILTRKLVDQFASEIADDEQYSKKRRHATERLNQLPVLKRPDLRS